MSRVDSREIDASWLDASNVTHAIARLKEQEEDLIFIRFGPVEAFHIGSALWHNIPTHGSALVSIRLFSGLTLFQAAKNLEVQPDNEEWAARKLNTVRRFGKSSLLVGRELVKKGRDINSLPPEYAAHGGAFPIRLEKCPYPIGAIIVSGLPQWQDHAVVIETLEAFCPLPPSK